LSGRVPVLKVQIPEFKLQYCTPSTLPPQKKDNKLGTGFLATWEA
jgi:hypothetical protein